MNKKTEAELLIYQLCIRFQRKPRKCRKINDSGIGYSERIVSISNDRFFYYPKIQQFNDLDFDKLQYVVPKAGIPLSQILQLKFPPRRYNERNYFTIIIPSNKIFKYGKTSKEPVIDETAEGEQHWTFIFDYDIISLPEMERRLEVVQLQQREKLLKKRQKEEEDLIKKQEQTKRKIQQQYESLVQTEKLLSQKGDQDGQQLKRRKMESDKKQRLQKLLNESEELYFHEAYRKFMKVAPNQAQHLECQLDILEAVGRFKKRAEHVIRKYIDELPFNQNFNLDTQFTLDNFLVKIGTGKNMNLDYLDNLKVAHALYNIRLKMASRISRIRVPLTAFIKYKGFKVIVRALTPCDFMNQRQRQQQFLHGNYEESWKTNFFLVDDLNIITDALNLKPYNSEVYFQKVLLHLGLRLQVIETKPDPFADIKALSDRVFSQETKQSIIYMYNISEVFPIDLDLQKNIKQNLVRLRPQYVQNYKQNGKELTKLVAGAMTYEYEDEQGAKDDYQLAKASQNLKYVHLVNFVQDLDKLKYIPMNSEHFKIIMKENGINIRYISTIYKLTNLPYIREFIIVEAAAREIKKIYRDYQRDFIFEVFRESFKDMVAEAFDKRSMNSLKVIRIRQLGMKQKEKSIQNAIDFLNLIFGSSQESESFWQIIKQRVKQNYDIEIKQHADLSHGYLLTTVLYHCGFSIKLNNNLLLFSTPTPFQNKDWIQFKCRTSSFTFPSMEAHKKCKITSDMTQQAIINRLELSLYICRALGNDENKILAELANYTSNPDILPKQKFTLESLRYYVANASMQNFNTAYQICTFVLPSSHPFFQDLYLEYAALKTAQSVTFKKAAQNHALRTLGLHHWKTSAILSGFKEQAYLKHLIAAETGVEVSKKMQLYHKIINEQNKLGKYIDCSQYVKRAITFAQGKVGGLNAQEIQEYFRLLMIGIQAIYKLRLIQEMEKTSQYFWNALQKYRKNEQCHQYIEHILYYCLKGFLEYSNKKFYLFKITLILTQKLAKDKPMKKQLGLKILRQRCRQSLNHINWLKQMLTKLEFAFSEINFLNDFFANFWKHVKQLHSQELDQGLEEMELVVRVFGKRYFEEALLDRSYIFYKGNERVTFDKK